MLSLCADPDPDYAPTNKTTEPVLRQRKPIDNQQSAVTVPMLRQRNSDSNSSRKIVDNQQSAVNAATEKPC